MCLNVGRVGPPSGPESEVWEHISAPPQRCGFRRPSGRAGNPRSPLRPAGIGLASISLSYQATNVIDLSAETINPRFAFFAILWYSPTISDRPLALNLTKPIDGISQLRILFQAEHSAAQVE